LEKTGKNFRGENWTERGDKSDGYISYVIAELFKIKFFIVTLVIQVI
jgi:hypothetical protein